MFSESSEHTIDHEKAAFEVQYIFRNIKYASYDVASRYVDGLVIIAVLGDVSDCNSSNMVVLEDLARVAPAPVTLYSEHLAIGEQPEYSLKALINMSKGTRFYIYPGSMTTAPYCQSVTWIVALQKYLVSKEQVS